MIGLPSLFRVNVTRVYRQFKKSKNAKNIATLFGGATIAQLVPILVSPLITRLYTPEDFGVLALFMAFTSVPALISSGRYDQAILLPKNNGDAVNVIILSLFITFLTSLTVFTFILFGGDYIIDYTKNTELNKWIYLVPFCVLIISTYNVFSIVNIRINAYKNFTISSILRTSISVLIQISLGLLGFGFPALLLSLIVSHILAAYNMARKTFILFNDCVDINLASIRVVAQRYARFPKLSLPATLLNTSTGSLVNIAILTYYGASTLGVYSLVIRLVAMPVATVGSSFSKVFHREAITELNTTGFASNIFKKTFFQLSIIGVPIFLVIYFSSDYLFGNIFGHEWQSAGLYTKLLVPFFYVRFISASLSVILSVYEKQNVDLIFNIVVISVSLILFYVSDSIDIYLKYYGVCLAIIYALPLIYYWQLVNTEKSGVIENT